MKKQEKPKQNPEVEVLKNQLARVLADFDNLQKRTQEEKITYLRHATRGLVANLLPIIDIFEASLVHTKDQGLAIGISQFKDLLKQEGFEEIKPKMGDNFDENLMEASEVVELPADAEPDMAGKVSELVMPGWRFIGGQVIRHARVKVFRAEKAS